MAIRHALTVTDLDGTYVRGNTLHIYIRCGIAQMVRRRAFGKLLRTLGLLALRRLHLVGHRTMKFGICGLIDPEDNSLREDFRTRVEPMINPAVRDALKGHYARLLATAAPETYVPWIWDGPYVATRMEDNPGRTECRGEEKLRRIREFIKPGPPVEPYTLYTDHSDDIPLMHAFREVVLVSPSAETVARVKGLGIKFTVIN